MAGIRFNLHVKLLGYFTLLALIVLFIGGAGVVFVQIIKKHFSTLDSKITPINASAQEVMSIASRMHGLSYQGGAARSLEELGYVRDWMIDEELNFENTFNQTAALIEEAAFDIDLTALREAEYAFEEAIETVFDGYEDNIYYGDELWSMRVESDAHIVTTNEHLESAIGIISVEINEIQKNDAQETAVVASERLQALLQLKDLKVQLNSLQIMVYQLSEYTDSQDLTGAIKQCQVSIETIQQTLAACKKHLTGDALQKSVEAMDGSIAQYVQILNGEEGFFAMQHLRVDNIAALFAAEDECFKAGQVLNKALSAMKESTARITTDAVDSVNAINSMASVTLWVAAAAGVVIAVLLAVKTSRQIARPLETALDELAITVSHVNRVSVEGSALSNALSEGAILQASSVSETSTSLSDISSQSTDNASNAQEAADSIKMTVAAVEGGFQAVEKMQAAMADIYESSARIREVIGAIETVAFQTNLLALNAAVEAARAGEYGRGFTVVAEEVRRLAQNVAVEANKSTELVEEALLRVESGRENAESLQSEFEEISKSADSVAQIVSGISDASTKQGVGVRSVAQSISQIEQQTHRNEQYAGEVLSNVKIISDEADRLREIASILNQLVKGTDIEHSDE